MIRLFAPRLPPRAAALLATAACVTAACGAPDRVSVPLVRNDAGAPIEYRSGAASPSSASGSVSRSGSVAREPARGESVVVPEGATLYQISEAHRVSLNALIAANALNAPDALAAGQTLSLPARNTYVVQPGDTFLSVARLYSIQPRSLALLNRLEEPYAVRAGDVLELPDGAQPQTAATPTPAAAPARPAAAVPTGARASAGPAPGFLWPLEGAVIDGFGPKAAGRRNDGVNIAARQGALVRAAADGLVVYAGSELEGYGGLVLVRHEGGWVSAYAHNRTLLVAENQIVAQGQAIAEVGDTGGVDRPQLHFELRRGGEAVDPLTALPPRPS